MQGASVVRCSQPSSLCSMIPTRQVDQITPCHADAVRRNCAKKLTPPARVPFSPVHICLLYDVLSSLNRRYRPSHLMRDSTFCSLRNPEKFFLYCLHYRAAARIVAARHRSYSACDRGSRPLFRSLCATGVFAQKPLPRLAERFRRLAGQQRRIRSAMLVDVQASWLTLVMLGHQVVEQAHAPA